MKTHGKGILEGAASDRRTLCGVWTHKETPNPNDTAWNIVERQFATHLEGCIICQTITEFCKREKVKCEKRWLTLASTKATGNVWFWKRTPSATVLARVPEGTIADAEGGPIINRSKPVFLIKLWSRASLNAKMKTNPDDLLVQRIGMLLLAREVDVPKSEWANVVAAGESLLASEAEQ